MTTRRDPPVERALDVLLVQPAGLITDIDGTISCIAPTPSRAVVDPQARDALERLARRLALVAVGSGRGAQDARRMVGAADVVYVGNHGLERLSGSRVIASEAATIYRPRIADALAEVGQRLAIPHVIYEDKGMSASIHVRGAPDPALAEREILAALRPVAERLGLRITTGRMVIEIRPPVAVDKGTAVRELIAAYHLRAVLFVGDDVTDIDAMRAVASARDEGQVAGLTVGVVGPETPEGIIEASDLTVEGVDGVVQLLTGLADALDAPG